MCASYRATPARLLNTRSGDFFELFRNRDTADVGVGNACLRLVGRCWDTEQLRAMAIRLALNFDILRIEHVAVHLSEEDLLQLYNDPAKRRKLGAGSRADIRQVSAFVCRCSQSVCLCSDGDGTVQVRCMTSCKPPSCDFVLTHAELDGENSVFLSLVHSVWAYRRVHPVGEWYPEPRPTSSQLFRHVSMPTLTLLCWHWSSPENVASIVRDADALGRHITVLHVAKSKAQYDVNDRRGHFWRRLKTLLCDVNFAVRGIADTRSTKSKRESMVALEVLTDDECSEYLQRHKDHAIVFSETTVPGASANPSHVKKDTDTDINSGTTGSDTLGLDIASAAVVPSPLRKLQFPKSPVICVVGAEGEGLSINFVRQVQKQRPWMPEHLVAGGSQQATSPLAFIYVRTSTRHPSLNASVTMQLLMREWHLQHNVEFTLTDSRRRGDSDHC